MQSGEPVTADILNKILSIFNIYITDEGLNLLINTPEFKFDNLSGSLHKDSEFLAKLVAGAQIKDKYVKGVYIFTHKTKDSKYVGSYIQLVTRLKGTWLVLKESMVNSYPFFFFNPPAVMQGFK